MVNRPAALLVIGATLVAVVSCEMGILFPSTGPGTTTPITVLSFQPGPPTPAGPSVALSVVNVGSYPIAGLTATVYLPSPFEISFPKVTTASPLSADRIATTYAPLFGGGGFSCGVGYPMQILGNYSTGASFSESTVAPFSCNS